MSSYLGPCWRCDSCKNIDMKEPWKCPGCNKEVCEYCFSEFGHCKVCSDKELDKEKLRLAANKTDGFDFEKPYYNYCKQYHQVLYCNIPRIIQSR